LERQTDTQSSLPGTAWTRRNICSEAHNGESAHPQRCRLYSVSGALVGPQNAIVDGPQFTATTIAEFGFRSYHR
jgi:hypothetical protein